MANFCTKCGKKLEKDEKCTCEKIKKDPDIKEKITNMDLFNIISSFIKKPYDTIKNTNLNDNKYLILVLSSLSMGLISYLFIYTRYINYFLTNSIISFIVFIILGVVINAILNYVYQEKIEFNDTLDIVSLSSIHLLVGNIVAFVLAFLSFKLGTLISVLSIILFVLDIEMCLKEKTNINKNKINYVIISSILVTILISLLIFKII